MKIRRFVSTVSFQIILSTFFFHFCNGQNFAINTRDLHDLVKKWNYANNWRSEETFRSIYLTKLIFYAQNLSRERCVSLKRKFFLDHPEYKQKIISDPVFTPYTSGIIKCEFIKESLQRGVWKKYPSYLLITYENNQYYISGESDLQTDKVLKYNLDIGEPMDIPQFNENEQSADSIFKSDTLATTDYQSHDSMVLEKVSNEVLSDEIINIPKKYLYFLIGFLALAAFILLVWKPRKSRNNSTIVKAPATIQKKDPVIFRHHKAFEGFVVSLFDPHYFALRIVNTQKALAGGGTHNENITLIEVEVKGRELNGPIFVECQFMPEILSSKVPGISGTQLSHHIDFQEAQGMEVYLILGLGGEPDNPTEVYMLRPGDLEKEFIVQSDLQPYRKHGMFFYSESKRKLQ